MAFRVGQYVTPRRFIMKRGLAGALIPSTSSYQAVELFDWNGRLSTIGRVTAVGSVASRRTTSYDPQTSLDAPYPTAGPYVSTGYTVDVFDVALGTIVSLEYPEEELLAYTGPGKATGLHYDESKITDIVEVERALAQ